MHPVSDSEDNFHMARNDMVPAMKKTIQLLPEPPVIKSALRQFNPSEKMSTKSVGIGSHNINEDNSS